MKPHCNPVGWRLLLLLGLATAAEASLTDDLGRCRLIADPAARLACYDGIGAPAAALPPADGSPPTGPSAPAEVAAAAPLAATAGAARQPSPEALFGVDPERSEDALMEAAGIARLDEIDVRVTAVRMDAEGKRVIEFDNGQVWRQLDSPPARLEPGDGVRIRRAAFGSYLLLRPDGGRGVRVRRIG